MICVVLAAGYATRLYPLTEHFPKPLLEVNSKSIIDWLIDDIDGSKEANEYIVVTNSVYAGHFEKWARGKRLSGPITVLDDGSASNENRLGAVGDIIFAMERRHINDDMLVVAGDNVLDFSLKKFIDYAKNRPGSCAMRYFEPDVERLKRAGVAEIDDEEHMLDMVEKPAHPMSNWCVPPFYYYKKKDLGLLSCAISEGCPADAPGSALAWLGARTRVYMMLMPGRRFDIGTLETYEQVKREYKGIKG